MESLELKKILNKKLKTIYVKKENNHFYIIAIDKIFSNLSEIERHKVIYNQLSYYINKQEIHSLSIKTFSIKEWENYIFDNF